jgi:phenylacetate-CoA ligase
MREYFWQRRDFRGSLGAIRIFMNNAANPPEGMSSPGWGQAIGALYETGQAHGLSVTAHPDAQLDWLERKRPDYLTSFPSNFRALIEHARRTGRSLPPVRELRTVGETLAPEDRALLAEAWCTRITDMYTCEEAGYLALQCPDQPGYHVQAEHVILEVLDDAGRPCAPGEIGRVVLTDLHNFATPFIRYAIGDLAEVGAPCPCGRGLPTLRRIAGRVRNLLRLPDGTRIYPRLGELRLASMPGLGVTHYRVIQRSLGLLELELVAGRKPTEAEAADIAKGIRESIGHPFEVRVSPVDALPAAPNGKFEVFISEVP